jgi:hypothetical protein
MYVYRITAGVTNDTNNVARIMLQLKITLITSVLKVLTRAITSVTNISL